MPVAEAPLKLTLFSTLYPNAEQPLHGLFIEKRLRELCSQHKVDAQVLAPVPWFPFKSAAFGRYGVFARVPDEEQRNGLHCSHPRYPVIPGVGMNMAPHLMYRALQFRPGSIASCDLVDAHFLYPDCVAAVRLAKRYHRPVVVNARGSDVNLYRQFDGPRRALTNACHQADAVVCVSRALADALSDLGIPDERLNVIRNGVDSEHFSLPHDASEQTPPTEQLRLLCVGHLVELKGFHLVVEAMAQLPGASLRIVGDGPEMPRLKSLVDELELKDRVTLPGAKSVQELPAEYAQADALVLASSREGMPNVVLEAMASGLAIIATRVGGIPEIVDPEITGPLMESRTAKAVVDAARALGQSPRERLRIRRHALKFSWSSTAASQMKLFEHVVQNAGK